MDIAGDVVGVGSIGSGSSGIWSPEPPPAAGLLHSSSDEFIGPTIDPKWLDWDVAGMSATSWNASLKCLELSMSGNGGIRHAGVYQAIPAAEFVVYAKYGMACGAGPCDATGGIFVADNLTTTPSTADFRIQGHVLNAATSGNFGFARTLTAYNGGVSLQVLTSYGCAFSRMRVNGTTVSSDFSFDGQSWQCIASVVTAFAPVHFGVCAGTVTAATNLLLRCKWFRVFTGAGCSAFGLQHIGAFL